MEGSLILCDYAQVNNGKLYVVGAGINLLVTSSASPPHPIGVWLAALVTVPWNAHNQAHIMKIYVKTEDGEAVPIAGPLPEDDSGNDEGGYVAEFNAGRSAHMAPGESSLMPVALPLQAPHPTLGGYVATLEIDGTAVTAANYRVVAGQPFSQANLPQIG